MDEFNAFLPAAFVGVFLVAFCNAMKPKGPRIGVYASYSLPSQERGDDYVDGGVVWGEAGQGDDNSGVNI
jgi:hypothetical protein